MKREIEDGTVLQMKKESLSPASDVLQQCLAECKDTLSSLSRESLQEILSDISNLHERISHVDMEAEKLEEGIQQIPVDPDAHSLQGAVSSLRSNATVLLSYSDEGCSAIIEQMQRQQRKESAMLSEKTLCEGTLNHIFSWCEDKMHLFNDQTGNKLQKDAIEISFQELNSYETEVNTILSKSFLDLQPKYLQLPERLVALRCFLTELQEQREHEEFDVEKSSDELVPITVEEITQPEDALDQVHETDAAVHNLQNIAGTREIPTNFETDTVSSIQEDIKEILNEQVEDTFGFDSSRIPDNKVIGQIDPGENEECREVKEDDGSVHIPCAEEVPHLKYSPKETDLTNVYSLEKPIDTIEVSSDNTTKLDLKEQVLEEHTPEKKLLSDVDIEETVEISTNCASSLIKDIHIISGGKSESNENNYEVKIEFQLKNVTGPSTKLSDDNDNESGIVLKTERAKVTLLETPQAVDDEIYSVRETPISKDVVTKKIKIDRKFGEVSITDTNENEQLDQMECEEIEKCVVAENLKFQLQENMSRSSVQDIDHDEVCECSDSIDQIDSVSAVELDNDDSCKGDMPKEYSVTSDIASITENLVVETSNFAGDDSEYACEMCIDNGSVSQEILVTESTEIIIPSDGNNTSDTTKCAQQDIDLLSSSADLSLVEPDPLFVPERLSKDGLTEVVSLEKKRKKKKKRGKRTNQNSSEECGSPSYQLSSKDRSTDDSVAQSKNTDISKDTDFLANDECRNFEFKDEPIEESGECVPITISEKDDFARFDSSNGIPEQSFLTEYVASAPYDDCKLEPQYSYHVPSSDDNLRIDVDLEIQNTEMESQSGQNETSNEELLVVPINPTDTSKSEINVEIGIESAGGVVALLEENILSIENTDPSSKTTDTNNDEILSLVCMPIPDSTTVEGQTFLENSLKYPLPAVAKHTLETSVEAVRFIDHSIQTSPLLPEFDVASPLEKKIQDTEEKSNQTIMELPVRLVNNDMQTDAIIQPVGDTYDSDMSKSPAQLTDTSCQTNEMQISTKLSQSTVEVVDISQPPLEVVDTSCQTNQAQSSDDIPQTVVEVIDIPQATIEVVNTSCQTNQLQSSDEISQPTVDAADMTVSTVEVVDTSCQTNQFQNSGDFSQSAVFVVDIPFTPVDVIDTSCQTIQEQDHTESFQSTVEVVDEPALQVIDTSSQTNQIQDTKNLSQSTVEVVDVFQPTVELIDTSCQTIQVQSSDKLSQSTFNMVDIFEPTVDVVDMSCQTSQVQDSDDISPSAIQTVDVSQPTVEVIDTSCQTTQAEISEESTVQVIDLSQTNIDVVDSCSQTIVVQRSGELSRSIVEVVDIPEPSVQLIETSCQTNAFQDSNKIDSSPIIRPPISDPIHSESTVTNSDKLKSNAVYSQTDEPVIVMERSESDKPPYLISNTGKLNEGTENDLSSDEQLEVQIHASVTFPSEGNKIQVTKHLIKENTRSFQNNELNVQSGSKNKPKKKQKKKSRKREKNNIDGEKEIRDNVFETKVDSETRHTAPRSGVDVPASSNESVLKEGEHCPLNVLENICITQELCLPSEENVIFEDSSPAYPYDKSQDLIQEASVYASSTFTAENRSIPQESRLPYESNLAIDENPLGAYDEIQNPTGTMTNANYEIQSVDTLIEEIHDPCQDFTETVQITEIVDDNEVVPISVDEDNSNIPCDHTTNDTLIEIDISDKYSSTKGDIINEKEEISSDLNKDDDMSLQRTHLIDSTECDKLDVCNEKEILYHEWKQVQSLVSNNMYKIQKERHTSCLSDVIYFATLQPRIADDTADQRNTALQHNINILQAAVDSKDKVLIHRTIISTVKTVYAWLESIEYHRLLSSQLKSSTTSDHIKKLNSLNNEIANVRQKVGGLCAVMEGIYCLFDNDEVINMQRCISNLQSQVDAMVELGNEKEQQALKDLNRWEEFLNGVNNVSVLVEELKEELDKTLEKDMLVQNKLEELDQVEATNHTYQRKATQLMNNGCLLLSEFPGREIPQELYGAYETTRSIEQSVKLERERQLQLIALADEYEQTLKDFAQIVDVADALVESSIVVSSLEHLQEEMQKHRKFFVNLSHCRCILESLEGNLDAETRNKHSELHQQQHTRASGILDKAAGRAQQMALAASRWTVLEQGMKEERSWLHVAHQRVPDLQSVTSSDYDQYISLFQSLSADVAVHYGHCAQLINLARNLQELVLCPGLETCYDEHMETVTKLQDDINKNLHSLLTFKDTWTNYVILTEKLCQWMKYAEKGLNTISSENQNPGAHMKHFWELKAQYEVHHKIRNEANSNFAAAMKVIPVADETLQRQLHTTMEEKWLLVTSQIENIQSEALKILNNNDVPVKDKLVTLQQELHELQSTLNDIHGIIKKEEELELYIQRMQVMLSCVEHIQEELSRLGLLSLDETEKVGFLLCCAGNIELQIKEEFEGAKVLYENINAIQKGINRIRRSYDNVSSVLDQCEASVTQGRDLVEQALNNCQGASEKLVSVWQDVMNLRQLLHTLPTSLHLSMSPVHLERKISQVQDQHTVLESRAANLQTLLKNRLALWRNFEQQLEVVQQSVQETDYMMELLTVQGSVDYDRLVKATECLEGLYGSLDQRTNLLDDLHAAAAPLTETCALEVSAKIKIAVEDVEKSWNNTRQALRDLCERYQDAARLWRQYRDASDCVKTWAEQLLDSTAHLSPSEALLHVKVCEETLEAHEACLGDLRGLVAQIAADVGLNSGGPLADDIAALGRRLDNVKESLAALYEVAESQQAGDDELNNTCEFLTSVKESLSMMEEASEKDIENQLNALRNHLLDLGKTEGQLQTLKEKTLDQCPLKSEAKVVEILQLWQQVFKETFQHYHRLSARLVKSQDGAAALKLWQEYLLHVQSFLSTSIPQDYRGLTEHQHLCEVHRNLLTSQQSVFLAQNEESSLHNAELSVLEQFNSLTNLHNETLARMMERHNEVGVRLASWEKYSKQQACLLSWLCDVERERNRLQLHNIHIRRIPKIIKLLQAILEDKMPHGEAQIQELYQLQNNLFHDIDDSVAASVRLEFAAINQRISNLKAALETWKDFLDRINNLLAEYEQSASTVQFVCKEIHQVICESCTSVSYADIENHLYTLQESRRRIVQLTSDLEAMNGMLEQLRECLNPIDMKMLNQRTWLLWQSHYDLDHRLAILCHQLEDQMKLQSLFETRYARFLSWVDSMELRMNELFIGDPEAALACFLKEIQSDILLKSREFQWLVSTGHDLVGAISGDDEISIAHEKDIKSKVAVLEKRWEDLHNLKMAKVDKLQNIVQNFSLLECQLSELRTMCHQIESQLMKPLTINECSEEVYEKILLEIEELQCVIEQQGGKISEILTISEVLLHDEELANTTIDIKSLSTVIEAIEKRWQRICEFSAERKCKFNEMWKQLKYVVILCKEKEPWIETQENILEDIQEIINQCSRSDYQNCLHQIKVVLDELELHNKCLAELSQSYTQILKNGQMFLNNASSASHFIHNVLQRWHALSLNAIKLTDILCRELKLSRDFINFHGMVVMNLTELDIRLTQFQHLHLPDEESSFTEREETLKMLQEELVAINGLVHSADELGVAVLSMCSPKDQRSIEEMIDEYKQLQNDITNRLKILSFQKYEKDLEIDRAMKKDESIQVETLRFEKDTAIQVNTLTVPKETASQKISICGFAKAIAECKANLTSLKDILEEDPPDGLKLATAIAQSQSSFELVKHLSARLEQKFEDTERNRYISLITDLHREYERLCSLACMQHRTSSQTTESGEAKLCPLCAKFNWQQLDSDLWRLEQWLQFSENTQKNYKSPPHNIEELEDTIQNHREFLMDLDSHENIIMSLNVVGSHLADHAENEDKAQVIRSRLQNANIKWDTVCERAARRQLQLHHALMENQDFHKVMEELMERLEKTEAKIRLTEPIDLNEEKVVLEAKYHTFKDLHEELERNEPRMLSLQDAASQFLQQSNALENYTLSHLSRLQIRLQSLKKITKLYVQKLSFILYHNSGELNRECSEETDHVDDSVCASLVTLSQELLDQAAAVSSNYTERQHTNEPNEEEEDSSILSHGYQFLGRVLKASLPVQALMLLIIGVASLLPSQEQDYSCLLTNNLAKGFEPTLFYPNGPPPV